MSPTWVPMPLSRIVGTSFVEDPGASTLSTAFVAASSQYVTMGAAAHVFDHSTPFSVSFWGKLPVGSPGGYIFAKMAGSTTYRGYGLALTGSGALNFHARNNQPTPRMQVDTVATGFADGVWRHYTVTKAGTSAASGVKIYANAVDLPLNVVADALGTSTIQVGTVAFQLNGRNNGNEVQMDMLLDDVAVWNRVLTPAEVAEIYNGGKTLELMGVTCWPACLSWWKMGDKDTYPTLLDAGPASKPGTMVNMSAGSIVSDVP